MIIKKIINYIRKRLYANETIILYSLKNYQPQPSVATIKHTTDENINDILHFQPQRYIDIFKNFLSLGDKGYFAYLQDKCVHRSWVKGNSHEQRFFYLVAAMDWYSRKVLSWRISNTMDTDSCIEALEEAKENYGTPQIFNTDQGSQFTSQRFTRVLKEHGIRISMDGRGRWMDNVFIERLWRSLKYECVYLQGFESGSHAKRKIGKWMEYNNTKRPHSTFGEKTPFEVYYDLPINGVLKKKVDIAA